MPAHDRRANDRSFHDRRTRGDGPDRRPGDHRRAGRLALAAQICRDRITDDNPTADGGDPRGAALLAAVNCGYDADCTCATSTPSPAQVLTVAA